MSGRRPRRRHWLKLVAGLLSRRALKLAMRVVASVLLLLGYVAAYFRFKQGT